MKIVLIRLVAISTAVLLSLSVQAQNMCSNGGGGSITKQVVSVFDLDSQAAIVRARSIAKRKSDSVCVSLKTRDLEEGAYSAWWMVFNNPSACSGNAGFGDGQCAGSDVSNTATQATVMWAGATLVGPNSQALLNSCLETNQLSHVVMPVGTQEGLTDPTQAEVHLIIRTHGDAEYADAALLGSQLNSFNGACEDEPSRCMNIQAAIHPGR